MKQQQKQNKKKKRRASNRPPPARDSKQPNGKEDEERNKKLAVLIKAFDSVTIDDATSAIEEAGGDVDKAAEILSNMTDNSEDLFSRSVTESVSGSSSSGSSSTGFSEVGFMEGSRNRQQKKKVVAATGMVSTLLGKDYVKASPRRDGNRGKRFGNVVDKEEAERFLFSMLGDDCELSMAVVRDVLCQCGYNVDKALDSLLDLSASSCKSNDSTFVTEPCARSTDRAFDYASHLSETEFDDNIWGYDCRNYSQVLTGIETPPNAASRNDKADLPQKVLESLFNFPKSSEHEPDAVNWKNVIKKMQSLRPGYVCPSNDPLPQQDIYAKGDEYHLFRQSANQHRDSMKSCFEKAAVAYSKGQKEYAAYLSDEGRVQNKMAREADEKARRDIFKARNKDIENMLTIDLHGQHVKQAMKVLKVHLIFGTYAGSIQILRVITGCGSHGVGKSKLKQSVIKLLVKEGIEWKEENQGIVLIKLDGYKEYSFLDSDGDSD